MNKLTFIFANPRSGSTLLMRLINNACMTKCVGDRSVEFYESIFNLWKSRKTDRTKYRPSLFDGSFNDEYSGYKSEEDLDKQIMRAIRALLFVNPYSSAQLKTTVLGFGNKLLDDMAKIIDVFDDEWDVTRVILKRDPEEIAESFISCPKGPLSGKKHLRGTVIQLVEKQNREFAKVSDFNTVEITYKELCEDPIKCLKLCNPLYDPVEKVVEKTMKEKIRW